MTRGEDYRPVSDAGRDYPPVYSVFLINTLPNPQCIAESLTDGIVEERLYSKTALPRAQIIFYDKRPPVGDIRCSIRR